MKSVLILSLMSICFTAFAAEDNHTLTGVKSVSVQFNSSGCAKPLKLHPLGSKEDMVEFGLTFGSVDMGNKDFPGNTPGTLVIETDHGIYRHKAAVAILGVGLSVGFAMICDGSFRLRNFNGKLISDLVHIDQHMPFPGHQAYYGVKIGVSFGGGARTIFARNSANAYIITASPEIYVDVDMSATGIVIMTYDWGTDESGCIGGLCKDTLLLAD